MNKGDLYLYYNYELDELFIVKRGVLFGKFMLESYDGTSKPYKTLKELETSSNLLTEAIYIQEI